MTAAAICSRAEVSRSAFYAHYHNPDDCLAEVLKQLFQPMAEALQGKALDPDTLLLDKKPLSYFFFAHIEEHIKLYSTLFYDQRGAGVLEAVRSVAETMSFRMHETLRKKSAQWDQNQADMAAAYLSGALVATARNWVKNGCPGGSLVMAYWFSSMAAPGLLESMGLEP